MATTRFCRSLITRHALRSSRLGTRSTDDNGNLRLGNGPEADLADNWQGSYFLMAVYGRALTAAEVQQNMAGANAN